MRQRSVRFQANMRVGGRRYEPPQIPEELRNGVEVTSVAAAEGLGYKPRPFHASEGTYEDTEFKPEFIGCVIFEIYNTVHGKGWGTNEGITKCLYPYVNWSSTKFIFISFVAVVPLCWISSDWTRVCFPKESYDQTSKFSTWEIEKYERCGIPRNDAMHEWMEVAVHKYPGSVIRKY